MSTINISILGPDETGVKCNVTFTPTSTPFVAGSSLIASRPVTVATDSTGAATVVLEPGNYKVTNNIQGNTDSVIIGVPNDSAVYNLTDLISAGTTLPNPPGLQHWKIKSAAYNALPGDLIAADTTAGAFTIQLPASPALGDFIQFADAQGTWAANNLTISRNGNAINRANTDLYCNVAGANFGLVWVGGATGWKITH